MGFPKKHPYNIITDTTMKKVVLSVSKASSSTSMSSCPKSSQAACGILYRQG